MQAREVDISTYAELVRLAGLTKSSYDCYLDVLLLLLLTVITGPTRIQSLSVERLSTSILVEGNRSSLERAPLHLPSSSARRRLAVVGSWRGCR